MTGAQRLVDRGSRELRLTIDAGRWRQATTLSERVASVSWSRTGVLAATATLVIFGAVGIHALARPDAYPPPDPTERELALRQAAMSKGDTPPPASLVEANKSWKAE